MLDQREKLELDWTHAEKKWSEHCHTSTRVDTASGGRFQSAVDRRCSGPQSNMTAKL